MNLRKIIEKFENECEKSGDPVMRCIWNHYLPMAEAASDETLKGLENKTLAGAIDKMRTVASKKHEAGKVAVLSDEEGYAIMDQCFGFDAAKKKKPMGGSSGIVSLFD